MSRKRKPVSAARIELHLWFADLATYEAFYAVPFARRSESVTEREWVSVTCEYGDDPNDGIEAVFRFTHTCRNDGAQRGDSEKFFRAVCNAAGISTTTPCNAGLVEVELLSRATVER